jgi:putative ABC transport system ATP-binding protein
MSTAPAMTSAPATSGAYTQAAQLPKTVKVSHLNHYFGEGELRTQALHDNMFEVRRGEIVIMTGPSGSGKTTLLTLIGTLRTVQEGSLKVLGNELNGATPDLINQIRKEIGFIFQAHNLFGSLTAFQNVNMAAELAGMPKAAARDRITELLTRLDLGKRIDYKPKKLSGGQKQRIAVARGLVHRPKLVLADEPTAALDRVTGRAVVTLFQEMAREEGCSIIIVTHDDRILDVADRLVKMEDGRIKVDVAVQETREICDLLRQTSLFSDLPTSMLIEIAVKMRGETKQPGEVVIRQGDPGELFYLIRNGKVDVEIEKGGKKDTVAQLHDGQFFGELALKTDEPRNATIVARAPSTFYTLGKADFKDALAKTKTFVDELGNYVAKASG